MTTMSCDQVRDLAAGFVLGALSPTEMEDVREHLATCPEPHPEFAELGAAVPYLAESVEPVEPPETLKARVLAVVAEAAAVATTPASPDVVPAARPSAAGQVISIERERVRRRSTASWVAAIAAVLLIAGLAAWNVQLRSELNTTQAQLEQLRTEVASTQAQVAQLRSDLASAQTELDASRAYQAAIDQVFTIANAPGGQAAILAPAAAGGPTGLAAIGVDGSLAIAMHDLPATATTDVYTAWVIGSNGVPVDVGSFQVGSTGIGSLTGAHGTSEAGLTIALTHEPGPGATAPTPPILSSGVVGSASPQG